MQFRHHHWYNNIVSTLSFLAVGALLYITASGAPVRPVYNRQPDNPTQPPASTINKSLSLQVDNTVTPTYSPSPTYTPTSSATPTPAVAYVKVEKVHDSNGNGIGDNGEQLIPGWEIEVDGSSRYRTGGDGVAFIPLTQGDHKICEVPGGSSWKLIGKTCYDVTIGAMDMGKLYHTIITFYNQQIYPTVTRIFVPTSTPTPTPTQQLVRKRISCDALGAWYQDHLPNGTPVGSAYWLPESEAPGGACPPTPSPSGPPSPPETPRPPGEPSQPPPPTSPPPGPTPSEISPP